MFGKTAAAMQSWLYQANMVSKWKQTNPFYATDSLLMLTPHTPPLPKRKRKKERKTSENQKFSHVFKGYRNRPAVWNGVKGVLQTQPELGSK